ncbi:aminotransferase class I/II-fold pyridoxal phosphate-dependent enzyme [Streptomyces sp. NPDC088124]|uniref:aminotransferase class I/II-fold pyridoxal phosphate-dependent enzyme n=1 Tax=Streptomyces sp. NPDC088124 TaxID=3154654 RepID=UPI00344928B4
MTCAPCVGAASTTTTTRLSPYCAPTPVPPPDARDSRPTLISITGSARTSPARSPRLTAAELPFLAPAIPVPGTAYRSGGATADDPGRLPLSELETVMPNHPPGVSRETRQGGDLTSAARRISLDLSVCSNRLGPPDSAVRALESFAAERYRELGPPPYGAEKAYLAAYAAHLDVDESQLLCGRGVTEFLMIFGRLLQSEDVALVTPEYTETMRQFSHAAFYPPAIGRQDCIEHRNERLLQAMRNHRYVVLSNPNNPQGLYTNTATLLEACHQNPNCTLVVDEEYIEFQGPALSLAGADADNLVVLQSTGKTWGVTATRAGILWTRDTTLHHAVQHQLPAWPLSLLDITVATAALVDNEWAHRILPRVRHDAQALEELLRDRFGEAVIPSNIHFRFVHLEDPDAVAEHLEDYGIAVRVFDGAVRGRISGMRVMTPDTAKEFDLLKDALATIPRRLRRGTTSNFRYPGKSVLETIPAATTPFQAQTT